VRPSGILYGRLQVAGRASRLRHDSYAGARGRGQLPIFPVTAQALARTLTDGQTRTLEGQQHNVDAEALAPVLVEFFKG
jgi:hypothetical protein